MPDRSHRPRRGQLLPGRQRLVHRVRRPCARRIRRSPPAASARPRRRRRGRGSGRSAAGPSPSCPRTRCSRSPTAGCCALIVFSASGSSTRMSASGAHQDRALPRVAVQDLGDVGRGDGDEFVRRQPAGADAIGPEHRHPVLEPAGAVGDLGEVADAGALLLGGEGAVVGGDAGQRAGGSPAQRLSWCCLLRNGGDITRRAAWSQSAG